MAEEEKQRYRDGSNNPQINAPLLLQFLNSRAGEPVNALYGLIVDGFPGFPGAREIGEFHRAKPGTLDERARRLLRTQCTYAGSAGFLTGLGGLASIAVSVPAALVLQATTVAAIAVLAGEDPLSPDVKAFVLALVAGDSLAGPGKRAAVGVAKSLAVKGVKKIPRALLTTINRIGGSRIVTKAGTRGIVNLGRVAPFAGAVIGGTADVLMMRMVGRLAIKKFISDEQSTMEIDGHEGVCGDEGAAT